jgi:hypothetical protein
MNQVEALNVLITAARVAYSKVPAIFTMKEAGIIDAAIDTFTVAPDASQAPTPVVPGQEAATPVTVGEATPFVSQAQTIQHRAEETDEANVAPAQA